ncbi:MAG: glycosyltransferase family 2 protein, partial [Terriglobia bacterium]
MGFQSNSGPTVDGSARHTEHVAFSVIIPTYNRAALTARAVDSVLENSACGRLEVLVVDDASSDGSLDMLGARYAGEARVRVISMSGNQGPSAARNRGLQAATGTFLLFLDSDDTLLPDALAFALAAFEKAPEMQFLGLEGNAVNASTGAWVHDAQKRWNPGWRSVHFGDWPSRTMQVPPPEGIEAPPATLRVGSLSEAILFGDLFYL